MCEIYTHYVPQEIASHSLSMFIDQACSIKMAGYWPHSLFACLWYSVQKILNLQKKTRTWPISSHPDLKRKWKCVWKFRMLGKSGLKIIIVFDWGEENDSWFRYLEVKKMEGSRNLDFHPVVWKCMLVRWHLLHGTFHAEIKGWYSYKTAQFLVCIN